MLTNTFCHIQGLGIKTENSIWETGIYTWDDFLISSEGISFLSEIQKNNITKALHESKNYLHRKNILYFYDTLPTNMHWRLYPNFKQSLVYLDIETTGLDSENDAISTIAMYDGKEIYWYINGENLEDFKNDIKNYKLIITYNGKQFDVPFLSKYFGIKFDQAHIDLRFLLSSLGYTGGLKSCEKQMEIRRNNNFSDIDGYFAVLLWHDYMNNNNVKSLETLLAYNIEDAINLETLMIKAYNLKLKKIPFITQNGIELSPRPRNPFSADISTIDKIKKNNFSIHSNNYNHQEPHKSPESKKRNSNIFIVLILIILYFIIIILWRFLFY